MIRACLFIGLLLGCLAATADASNETSPVRLRSYTTPYAIGIEWDLEGDANHNATCAVQFRRAGDEDWRDALDLFRVDYQGWWKGGRNKADRHYNMVAGSLMFLTPGMAYDVRLSLEDPDGGSTTEQLTLQTRALPERPTEGRTLHVQPGDGGGSGTEDDPFRGIEAADAEAQPGDTMLLHPGRYARTALRHGGDAQRHVVWTATDAGEAVLAGLNIRADHIWLEGLRFESSDDERNGLFDNGGHANVVVMRNDFHGFSYSIALNRNSRDWHITDNNIVGDKPANLPPGEAQGQLSGEGIELQHSEGHVVAYNAISRTADGVSYANRNVDIFGNDIRDVTDDGIEPDYGYANIRMWGNRITDSSNFYFSFQPMYCGPWYIIRNQATGMGYPYKFNGPTDRFLTAHNTFVGQINKPTILRGQVLLNGVSRNNLYISASNEHPVLEARMWGKVGEAMPENNFQPIWKTDVDYDGFDWGMARTPIVWDEKEYGDLQSFANDVGIERHAVRVDRRRIFEQYRNPADWLTLQSGSNAVDAGDVLPGINDDYAGDAPDLGAYEEGQPLPHYGPRDEQAMQEHGDYWSKW